MKVKVTLVILAAGLLLSANDVGMYSVMLPNQRKAMGIEHLTKQQEAAFDQWATDLAVQSAKYGHKTGVRDGFVCGKAAGVYLALKTADKNIDQIKHAFEGGGCVELLKGIDLPDEDILKK